MPRFIRLAALTTVLGVSSADGQSPVRISGVAFDSLSGRGLASAFITLGSRNATADSLGRFAFDSVPPGTYRLGMQHDVLDSLGLPGIASSVVVREPMDAVQIATPSSRTMWRRVCPGEQPRDSGFVFGVVRDASRAPVAGASIATRWIELLTLGGAVTQKGWRLDTRSGTDGVYVVCGVPVGTGASLEARQDSTAGTAIEMMLTDKSPVRRYDLTLTSLG